MQSEIEVDGLLWTNNAAPVACLFLLKVMLICDKPLLSGGHLPVPRGWPPNGGSNRISLFQLFLSLL